MQSASTRIGLLSLALLASPLLAQAAPFHGEIAGEARTWQVLTGPGQSSTTFTEIAPGIYQFSLQGYRANRHEVEGSISINFTVMGNQLPQGGEISYFPGKRLFPNYSGQSDTGLSLDQLRIEGDTARVVGQFAGPLPRQDGIGATADHDNGIDVRLHFDLTAHRH